MKTYILLPLLLATLFYFTNGFCQNQPPGIKTNLGIDVDKVGDATLTINAKYSAAMWDMFKRNVGTNNSILKQQVVREFPKYVIENFEVKTDDMERNLIMSFKVPGFASQDEKGKWKAALDSKNPDITKLTDKNFLLVEESSNQSMKINLPENADEAKVEKDSFGNAYLTYDADIPGGTFSNILKYLGIAIALLGVWLFYQNNRRQKGGGIQAARKIVPISKSDEVEENKKFG